MFLKLYMAPPTLKKARRPIGSMVETIVPETPNQDNDRDSDGSENDSRDTNTHISPSEESDNDETQNSDDARNNQGKLLILFKVFLVLCYTFCNGIFL